MWGSYYPSERSRSNTPSMATKGTVPVTEQLAAKVAELEQLKAAGTTEDIAACEAAIKDLEDKVAKKKEKDAAKAEAKRLKEEKKKQSSAAKPAESKVAAAPKKKKALERVVYENTTPVGEKKDVSGPMLAAYHPTAVESAWYSWWNKQGYFNASNSADDKRPTFVMMLPPPNVTGSLHIGHALMNSVEDAIARWHRMSGHNVLWLPGTDHAGIATQVVVEKKIARERNITRYDMGREAFVDEVWKWKKSYGDRIYEQLHVMGSSLDWERSCFTMDPVRYPHFTSLQRFIFQPGRGDL